MLILTFAVELDVAFADSRRGGEGRILGAAEAHVLREFRDSKT